MDIRTERIQAEEVQKKRAQFEADLLNRKKITRKDVEYLIASRNVLVSREHDIAPLNFFGKDLSGEDLSNLNFFEAVFHGATCVGTIFRNCDLRNTNFHGANLSGAIFDNARLDEANFCSSCICNASFVDAYMTKCNLSNACIENAVGLDINVTDDAISCFGRLDRSNMSGIRMSHG